MVIIGTELEGTSFLYNKHHRKEGSHSGRKPKKGTKKEEKNPKSSTEPEAEG